MKNTIANIRILDVVRLVHGYFIFVFLIINMLSWCLWTLQFVGFYNFSNCIWFLVWYICVNRVAELVIDRSQNKNNYNFQFCINFSLLFFCSLISNNWPIIIKYYNITSCNPRFLCCSQQVKQNAVRRQREKKSCLLRTKP